METASDSPNKTIYNERVNQLEQKRMEMVETLASLLHENWRKKRYDPKTGLYAPKIRKVKDQEWIANHNGLDEIDIANTAFPDLPADWREENFLSARVAIEKIEDLLNLVHDGWLDRNDQNASADQKTQYSRLSKDEKDKDIDVLEEALRIIKEKTD